MQCDLKYTDGEKFRGTATGEQNTYLTYCTSIYTGKAVKHIYLTAWIFDW